MRTRTALLIVVAALLVLGAAGALALRAASAGTPPDLGPAVVAPAGHGAAPGESGAPPVPVAPRVAGADDDPDDDHDDDGLPDGPDDDRDG